MLKRFCTQIFHKSLDSVGPGDFLVLATDGAWDYLTDQNAVDVVCKARKQ